MSRLPSWIRTRLACCETNAHVQRALRKAVVNTVCESALCPNKHECYGRGTATVMILGNSCTRNCRFCAVESKVPEPVDRDEPRRVAELAGELGLRHVVLTSVTRDDLPDGGAHVFAEAIARLKARPEMTVEVLTPDFQGSETSIATVLSEKPEVFNHNLETIRRLQPLIRPMSSYECSLKVLRFASAWSPGIWIKSGIMVGLGETDDELFEAMHDLFEAGCRLLTIGQYLAPGRNHATVKRYVHPRIFDEYRSKAFEMGFRAAAAGPLVRSSYHAERMMRDARNEGRTEGET